MEPILKDIGHSGTVKGVEVLFFEEAEIRKMKGGSTSFAAIGPLSVLYFKEYNRFVLKLNDWRYPLMRRLPVVATGKGDINSRVYTLPSLNGFSFELRINNPSPQGISNFETILGDNSGFSFKGEATMKKLEASPDDKLVRNYPDEDTGIKEVISQALSQAAQSVKNVTKSLKPGTTNLTSTKKKMNLNEIKTKNFKKDAHSTFKEDFFKVTEQASQEFLTRRRENPNLTQTGGLDALLKNSSHGPTLYIPKEEIEEVIFTNKDLIKGGIKI